MYHHSIVQQYLSPLFPNSCNDLPSSGANFLCMPGRKRKDTAPVAHFIMNVDPLVQRIFYIGGQACILGPIGGTHHCHARLNSQPPRRWHRLNSWALKLNVFGGLPSSQLQGCCIAVCVRLGTSDYTPREYS